MEASPVHSRRRGSRFGVWRGDGVRCVASAAAPPPARSSTKLPWTTRATSPVPGEVGAPLRFVFSSTSSRAVIPSGARCAVVAVTKTPAGPPRNPAAATASPVVRSSAPGARARAAQRAPTAIRRNRWHRGAMARHAAELAFTAEAHAARRGIERRRAVGKEGGLSEGASGFLGSPPDGGAAKVVARWAPLGMTVRVGPGDLLREGCAPEGPGRRRARTIAGGSVRSPGAAVARRG